jgi:capsular polysaccharide biosynthesis protein
MGSGSSADGAEQPAVPTQQAAAPSDPPIDLTRVAGAVRRHAGLVTGAVVFVMTLVLITSLRAPQRYDATARIAATGSGSEAAAADPDTVATALAASRELAVSPETLKAAAGKLPGRSPAALEGVVTTRVEPDASILDITASDSDPRSAADIANTVAAVFLERRALAQRAAAARAKLVLETQLAALVDKTSPSSLAMALRDRIGDLSVSEATAGSDLQLAEPAAPPARASAPRPLRNAVFAGLATLLLAIVAAVLRDRARRRAGEARQLAAHAGLPLLAVVPDPDAVTRAIRSLMRRVPRAAQREDDRTVVEQAALQAAVRSALPPRVARTLLVCGVDGAAGSSRVAAGLSRSLSWAGLDAELVDSTRPGPIADAIEEALNDGHRYVIVSAPPADGSSELPLVAWQAGAAILVGRLGRTSGADVLTATQLLDALRVHVLGLVLTARPADAAAVRERGFEPPAAAPRRVRRAPARNGRAPSTPESEPALWQGNGATGESHGAASGGQTAG